VRTKASGLFIRCLEAEAVALLFGKRGEDIADLVDACAASSIKLIETQDVSDATIMADSYARFTGKPGVCLVSVIDAPDAVAVMASAYQDDVPVITISGHPGTDHLHHRSRTHLDTLQLFEPVTRYNRKVLSQRTIPEIIRQAFSQSMSGNPGPSHIQVPRDIVKQSVNHKPLRQSRLAAVVPSPADIQEAARLIRAASRPIVLAGRGVIRQRAWSAVLSLIRESSIPLVSTLAAKGILQLEHSLNCFTVDSNDFVTLRPLRQADVIIAVGFELDEVPPEYWNPAGTRRMINVNTRPADTAFTFPVAMDLTGSIGETVTALAGALQGSSRPASVSELRALHFESLFSVSTAEGALVRDVLLIISNVQAKTGIVIADTGRFQQWVCRWYYPKMAGRTLIYTGSSRTGRSVPGAVAAALALPNTPVVAVTDKSGLQSAGESLVMARRLGLNLTIVVLCDTKESREYPHLRLWTKSYGFNQTPIQTVNQFANALVEAVVSRQVRILEVVTNSQTNH
jgi:acetolactate synthase I/II/III large subunit